MSTTTLEVSSAREIIANWYYNELWGWKYVMDKSSVEQAEEMQSIFLKSLLVVANGDGELSEKERNWVIGRGAAIGAPDSLLKELENYPASEDIMELISRSKTNEKSGRAVIYCAIQAAASDGEYKEGEKATIRKAAKAMGISEEVVKVIEELYFEEARLKEKRIALCIPDGNPFN